MPRLRPALVAAIAVLGAIVGVPPALAAGGIGTAVVAGQRVLDHTVTSRDTATSAVSRVLRADGFRSTVATCRRSAPLVFRCDVEARGWSGLATVRQERPGRVLVRYRLESRASR